MRRRRGSRDTPMKVGALVKLSPARRKGYRPPTYNIQLGSFGLVETPEIIGTAQPRTNWAWVVFFEGKRVGVWNDDLVIVKEPDDE